MVSVAIRRRSERPVGRGTVIVSIDVMVTPPVESLFLRRAVSRRKASSRLAVVRSALRGSTPTPSKACTTAPRTSPVPVTTTRPSLCWSPLTSDSLVNSESSNGWEGWKLKRRAASVAFGQHRGSVQGHDLTVVDEHYPVAEPFSFVHEMCDQHDGHATISDTCDELPGVPASLRVKAGRQLVEDRDLRVADQRERDCHPLLLASGEPPVVGVALRGEVEQVQQLARVGRVRVEGGEQLHQLVNLAVELACEPSCNWTPTTCRSAPGVGRGRARAR